MIIGKVFLHDSHLGMLDLFISVLRDQPRTVSLIGLNISTRAPTAVMLIAGPMHHMGSNEEQKLSTSHCFCIPESETCQKSSVCVVGGEAVAPHEH